MTRNDTPRLVQVDIIGASTLKLIVLDGGNTFNGDHANWVDAKLVR